MKYTVTHKCGHRETLPNWYPDEGMREWVAHKEKLPCTKCLADAQVTTDTEASVDCRIANHPTVPAGDYARNENVQDGNGLGLQYK